FGLPRFAINSVIAAFLDGNSICFGAGYAICLYIANMCWLDACLAATAYGPCFLWPPLVHALLPLAPSGPNAWMLPLMGLASLMVFIDMQMLGTDATNCGMILYLLESSCLLVV
ncbi:hypothetical protein U1Q18_009405, partial [Sarracenia purpurea var. burkii]